MKYVRPYKRWQKVAFWLFGTPTGRLLWGVPIMLLLFVPAYWLGLWWIFGLVGAMFAFVFGWNCAARHYRKNGYVSNL